jgi:endonuclease G
LKNFISLFTSFLLLVTLALPALGQSTQCPEHFWQGEAPDMVNPKLRPASRDLCFSGFAVKNSGLTRTPLWSSEHLTRDQVHQARKMIRKSEFHPESQLPFNERSELRDFYHSGLDRGHLSPSGDFANESSQFESFSLSNIVPQDPENNRGIWEQIERAVRTFAKREGELYVITGPLFIGEKIKVLNRRVAVPTHIFKAIYDPARNEAGVYLVNNSATADLRQISVADLEQISGINLFPKMPASVKQKVMQLPPPEEHRQAVRYYGGSHR